MAQTMTIARIERSLPIKLIAALTIALENPDSSITLPKIAPSTKTGKYSFTKSTILGIKTPENTGATSLGSVIRTANNAAIGANKITL